VRHIDEDEQDQQQALVVQECRRHVSAAQALLWLRRGRMLGGLLAEIQRKAIGEPLSRQMGHGEKESGMGGPSAVGSPDG
jgi:hypothetical protein